jgi:hypothetical protein
MFIPSAANRVYKGVKIHSFARCHGQLREECIGIEPGVCPLIKIVNIVKITLLSVALDISAR